MEWESKNHPKLQFSSGSNQKTAFVPEVVRPPFDEWDPTRWIFRETTQEDFAKGTLDHLVSRLPGVLKLPEDKDWCYGPACLGDTHEVDAEIGITRYTERLWCIFKAMDDRFYVAKAKAGCDDWESVDELVYVPTGAEKIKIMFDATGYYSLAFQLYSAGEMKRQLWLCRYPFSGNNIQKIVEGDRFEEPFVLMDHKSVFHYFYLDNMAADNTKVIYRVDTDDFTKEYPLPIPIGGKKEKFQARLYTVEYNGKPDYYLHALITFSVSREKLRRYIITEVLMENPAEPELYSIYLRNDLGINAALQSISWQSVPLPNQKAENRFGLTASFRNIRWVEVAFSNTVAMEEKTVLSTGLHRLGWEERVTVRRTLTETGNLATAVRAILWMKIVN